MYFDGPRGPWINRLQTRRSRPEWLRDRLLFPWIAFMSAEAARRRRLTPLDMERLLVTLPLVRGRLLDVGCGDNLLVAAYGMGTGVDIVDWGYVDRILPEDGTLPFADETFDTVTILAALNHIVDREMMLQECRRVLSPHGRIIISMLNPVLSLVVHRIRYRLDPDQTHRHQEFGEVWGLWPREIYQLLDRSGFALKGYRRFVWGLNRIYCAEVKL